MSEEVRIVKHNNGDGNGVSEWEDGLPGLDDLTPLSQALVPPELLSAFRITAEQPRSMEEVNTASYNTLASIRGQLSAFGESNNLNHFADSEDTQMDPRKKTRRFEEDDDSKNELSSSNVLNDGVGSAQGSKRARMVWTPQLHKRFVDVVTHLGVKSAVPKTIMQTMNVEGLTRENVASHLQKYRLYLKRMEEGPSGSDDDGHHQTSHFGVVVPIRYSPQMVPMPYIGMMGVGSSGNQYHGHYNMMQNKFGSFPGYHNRVTPPSSDN